MRLIDADALRDRLQNLAYNDWNQGATTSWADAYNECADMVDDMPSADVQPVRHERWTKIDGSGLAACSCGYITDRYSVFNYCPHCGAYMRGEQNGTD